MASRVAKKLEKVDGQWYKPGQTIPDLGTLVCYKETGNVREYVGVAADKTLLPTYVGSGSTAMLLSASGSEVYMFHNGTWYAL